MHSQTTTPRAPSSVSKRCFFPGRATALLRPGAGCVQPGLIFWARLAAEEPGVAAFTWPTHPPTTRCAVHPTAADDPDLLRNRSLGDRTAVISAGVAANMALALTICLLQASAACSGCLLVVVRSIVLQRLRCTAL